MLNRQPQSSAVRSDAPFEPFPGDHWRNIAQQWQQVGPPLRPGPQDIATFESVIRQWPVAPRGLIFGVTPELYRLSWPQGTDLVAVDNTQAMIDAVWPGPRSAVFCAEWTELPLPAASRDIVLCDGGMHLISDHVKLVRALHRVIAPNGLCAVRLFVPPDQREAPGTVLSDLLRGNIASTNILKLRLGMALQEDSKSGVQLGEIWNALHLVAPDLPELAAQLGWPVESLLAINTYRNSLMRYHFLSVAEVSHLFCDDPGGFKCETVRVPTYDLGEQCPTVVFRRDGNVSPGSVPDSSPWFGPGPA
jgi:SAM-dependent methyltransferase